MIYLDNAATTFPKPEEVYVAMDKINRFGAVNAGRGTYKAANEASKIIDSTKDLVKKLFHGDNISEVVFTPSVTHAMNQVIGGISLNQGDVVYITPYEHNAVARTIHLAQKKQQFNISLLPLTEDLKIDIEKSAFMFKSNPPSVVFANAISNVTGYVLPCVELFSLAKQYNAITVMDAAQAAGLIDIDMRNNNADIICFAGHKSLYGPFGIGGFVLRRGIDLEVSFAGGTGSNSLDLEMPNASPARYEASSLNIVAVAGLEAALKKIDQKKHLDYIRDKTRYLLQSLSTLDNVELIGSYNSQENLGIVSFAVDGYKSDEVGTILDGEFDIAVRTGFHCAPYIHEFLNDKPYHGTIRVGVGMFTTDADIDSLIEALSTL